MKPLTPLKCSGCGGSPPLVMAPRTQCPFCGLHVTVPENYQKAAQARRAGKEARLKAEPAWRRLSNGVPGVFLIVGGLLMLCLPPIATVLGHSMPRVPLASAQIIAMFSLPALLPGALVFTLAGALQVVGRTFQTALAARPPTNDGQPPGCRTCGAGLNVEHDALSASCGYCDTDSIVTGISARRERAELGLSLRSLADAVRALKRRWAWITGGLLGAFSLIGGLSALVAYAFFATV